MYTVKPWNVWGIDVSGPSLTDPIDSHLPEIFRKFYQGDRSFWNNYNAFGYPESYNYFLNPVNYVYLLPLNIAIFLNSLIKYSVAYFGMCTFLKRLKLRDVAVIAGGVSYALSSAMAMWNYWAHTDVMMWLPFLFAVGVRLLEEKRPSDIFKMSLIVYMMCVAGMPAFAVYGFYLFVPYIVIMAILMYKNFKDVIMVGIRFILAFVLGIIASAAYVYYVYRMAVKNGYLEKRGGLSTVTLEHKYIKTYLLPFFRDGMTRHINESCSYFGIVALVILPFVIYRFTKKKQIYWLIALALCSIFAYTHWLDVIYTHIPAVSTSLKIRMINLIPFVAVILASLQINDIVENRESYNKFWMRWPVYILVGVCMYLAKSRVPWERDFKVVIAVTVITFVATELMILFEAKFIRKTAYLLLLATVIFNMTDFSEKRNTYIPKGASVIPEATESIAYMQKNSQGRIYTYSGWSMFPNANVYYGLKSIEAHGLINTNNDIGNYMRRVDDTVYASATDTRGSKVDNYNLLQYAGVDFISGSSELENVAGTDYKMVLQSEDGMTLYQTDKFAPRFYLASSFEWIETSKQVMKKLCQSYVEGAVFSNDEALKDIRYKNPLKNEDTVSVVRDEMDDVTLSVNSTCDRILVFNEYSNENWEVFVDGAKTDLLKVNYLFNGVKLSKGEHTVRFKYNAYHQVTFLYVTAVSVFILFILSILSSIKESKKSSYADSERDETEEDVIEEDKTEQKAVSANGSNNISRREKSMKLIIQIPCFNEAETLEIALNDLPKHIDGIDEIEYLIINDGSKDNTVEVAKKWGVNYVVNFRRNKGLAHGFMAGLDACLRNGADIIVNTDADNQYNGEDIETIVRPIIEGKTDIVIGERPIDQTEHFSPLKKKLQHFGSWVVRKASNSDIPDAPSGFRAYSREAALRMNVTNEYTYTLETIVQAGRQKIAQTSVPIRTNGELRPSRLFSSMFGYVKKSMVTILRAYLMYLPLKTFSILGTIPFIAGLVIDIRFLVFFFQGHGSGHVQSLVLGSTFIMMGVMIYVIGLLADVISRNRKLLEEIEYHVRRLDYDRYRDDIKADDGLK
ncbi:MAG: glycosyltransferase [Eubacterium sp.]|nr:glycosyltransferase [Eubacterium sp.]